MNYEIPYKSNIEATKSVKKKKNNYYNECKIIVVKKIW